MALLSGTPGEPLQDPQPPSCPTTGGEDASGDRLSPLFPLDSSKIESNSGKIASSEELPHTDMKLGHDVCMVGKKFVEGGDSRQGELVEVDVGSHFETQQLFASKELLIQWVRAVSRGLGFVVTIRASDKIVGRFSPRVFLGCDRGGIHRDKQSKVNVKKRTRKRSSKCCGCPFIIKGQKVANVDEWKLDVLCGKHNHECVHLEAHSYAGRLNDDEGKLVEQMYISGVKPRKILSLVKKGSEANTTTIRTIYNERVKLQKRVLDGGTPIQFLYKCIYKEGYVCYNKVDEMSNQLRYPFFAHPVSIKLSHMFPTVFQLDCTYKTNRYRMPLLCIVGVTSTYQSFFSCFTFMYEETEVSYRWALDCFKSILDPSSLPVALVTDRDLTLMNAIHIVFPHAKNLLCQVHINRNILANCKKFFCKGKEFKRFMLAWQRVVTADTENDATAKFNALVSDFSGDYPEALAYVNNSWLEPYREYFLCAWTDKYLHLGSSTTNRVEIAHSQLKRFLEVSIANLTTIWKTFDQMITLQHTDIKRSFGQSCIQVNKDYTSSLYSELLGHVSLKALECIKEEEDLVKKGSHLLAKDCTHKKRFIFGLPCSHELMSFISQSKSCPLWLVHRHWKILTMKETKSDDHKKGIHEDPPVDINTELEGILQRFAKSNEHQRKEIKRKLREIVEPSSTQTAEPSHPSRLKGRPKGSFRRFKDDWKSTKREPSHFEHVLKDEAQKVELFRKLNARKRTRILLKNPSQNEYLLQQVREILPPYLAENVVHVTDVLGDGHCGFRVVSRALDMQEDWLQIRKALYRELENHVSLYDSLFGNIRRNELLASLDCTETPAPIDNWMSLPDLGLVIASCFNVGVVQLSCNQCFTFLPLYSMPPTVPKMISIGFINGNHFILLELREDCQLPEIFSPWRRYHEPIAEAWASLYMSRITLPRASMSSVFHTFDGAHNPFNLASLKQKEPSKEVDEVEEDWNRIPESILSSLVQAHNQLFGSGNLVIPDGFTCTQMLTTHISLDDATNLLLVAASVGVQLVSKFQLIWLCWANVPPGIIGMPLLMERLVIM